MAEPATWRADAKAPRTPRFSGSFCVCSRRGGRPAAATECRDRRRDCAVPELPAGWLVVPRVLRVRGAGLGADARNHHACRRVRVRISVRAGLLPPAAAVDQWTRRSVPVDRPVNPGGAVPRSVRPARRRGPATARLAAVVRRAVGCPGVAQVDGAVRWIPLGSSGFQSNRQSDAADRPTRRCAAAVVRGRADRIQHGRNRFRDRPVVASRQGQTDQRTTGRRAGRGVYQRCAAGDGAGVAERAEVRCRGRRRSGDHGGRRTGQRAAARAGVQRAAPGRPRQSRPRNHGARRRRARGQGAAADDRHLAGELLGYRSAGQPGRQSADLHRRGSHRRTDPGRGRRRGTGLPPRQSRCRRIR